MLGGFNSVKRENHHYKYAHCTNIADIKRINSNFKEDYANNEKNWNWNLSNYVHDGSQNFLSGSTMVSFNSEMPKTKNAKYFFYNCKSLKEANTNYKDFTNVDAIFQGCVMSDWPKDFSPNTTVLNSIFSGGAVGYVSGSSQPVTIPYNESIDKATSLSGAFYGAYVGQTTWFRQIRLDSQYKFSNLVDGSATFHNGWPYTITGLGTNIKLNLVSLTNGNNMFNGCAPLTDFESPLPSLSSGSSMFWGCNLNKDSLFKLRDNLPTWEDGKTHNMTNIGLHLVYKYDKEIHQTLDEIAAKGWTVSAYWNKSDFDYGMPFPKGWPENEVMSDEIKSYLNLDSITLPYGYYRCEYLEDTGTQFIDTILLPNNTIGMWSIHKQISTSASNPMVGGAIEGSKYFYVPRWPHRNNNAYSGFSTTYNFNIKGWCSTAMTSVNWLNNKKSEIYLGDKDNYSTTHTDTTFTINNSITLFKRNGSTDTAFNGRIYRVKISEGDQIIRDFIPALDPDAKPCMYEMIEGKPYYNAATSGNDFLYKVYEDYVMPELPPYDIVEGSKYIPDASSWNEEVYTELTGKDIKIVRVVNGIAYDE